MKLHIKQKFIEALEGGFYLKTKTSLRNDEGYCSLGVLCDLYSMETTIPWRLEYIAGFPFYSFESMSTILPDSVRQWSGLTEFEEENIMAMNDNDKTFVEIAKWLKVNQ